MVHIMSYNPVTVAWAKTYNCINYKTLIF